MTISIAPSILACDFARLAEECRRAEDAGADELHVDVMDGHYVRNITIGPLIVEAARRSTKLPLNVHLMIDNPEVFAADFVEAGADCILVHPECDGDPGRALEIVRELGVKTGVALNPETPVSAAADFLPDVDFLLVMSVNPGWGGQKFMRDVLPKFAEAKPLCCDGIALGIDGGIGLETGREAVLAGANYLIAGTFLFGSDDMAGRVAELRRLGES
jgi:ribulose-phosphate 3-epimerase